MCLCREEISLVDQFVFEILVVFVESLGLAHSDERSMGNFFFSPFSFGSWTFAAVKIIFIRVSSFTQSPFIMLRQKRIGNTFSFYINDRTELLQVLS